MFYILKQPIYFLMAKKKGGHWRKARMMRGYRKLPFSDLLAGGTLASEDVTAAAWVEVMTETRLISTIDFLLGWRDFTPGNGPIEVGIAHSDYSAAEIEEALESTGSWDEGDLVAQEQAARKVRRLGILAIDSADGVWNDGRRGKVRLNWRIDTGDTLQTWIRNRAGAPLITGGEVTLDGWVNSWRK